MRGGRTIAWRVAAALAAAALLHAAPAAAQRFFPDDPIGKEPPPRETSDPRPIVSSGLLEYFVSTFGRPGARPPEAGVIPARNANTLGEVPDSPWFTNRHGRRRLGPEELRRGAGDEGPPSTDAPWRVIALAPRGEGPGMLIADATGACYRLRFDAPGRLGLATGAEIVGSRFYHAAGYNVAESYLVYFERGQLQIDEGGAPGAAPGAGDAVAVDWLLANAARDPGRGYRAVATRLPDGTPLGPYRLYGTRSDDPNDVVAHEHRRDLRGLWVLNAWLGNAAFDATHTMDYLVQEDGHRYIRHYLTDFAEILGSGDKGPKAVTAGNEYRFTWKTALKNAAGMGIYTPGWMRASYPGLAAVGSFESASFDPVAWKPATWWATWVNRLPDDSYWGAKLVMSFTDDDIRTIVETGGYGDPQAVEWITAALTARRDAIGRAFLPGVLPLDDFRVAGGRLLFDDLMVRHGFAAPSPLTLQWHQLDNGTGRLTAIGGPRRETVLPSVAGELADRAYLAADIGGSDPDKTVVVYLRKQDGGFAIVGVERGSRPSTASAATRRAR